MKHIYNITGMTCSGCVASVKEKLEKFEGVSAAHVDLEKSEAHLEMMAPISLDELKTALGSKYGIEEKASIPMSHTVQGPTSKWKQLKPLFLIFAYLFTATFLLNYVHWDLSAAMLDFMGLFYVVFSFFKLLDLKGFPESFAMYDPLAKKVPIYGRIYPFIEVALGLMFLMRIQLTIALVLTIIVLGLTTIGVVKTLVDKKSIRCACLGTALNLPMTEATFIENAIMLVMAVSMLFLGVV